MDDQNGGWKQFQKLNLDSKKISKHVRKAEGATLRHAHKFIIGRLDNIRVVRRTILSWLLLVGVIIFAVSLQFIWSQQNYLTSAAAPGGTYAEASLGPIETLNPLYASSSAEIAAGKLLYSSLYTYDPTGHLRGDLAEDVQVDPTGMIYTIKVRQDAKWHDGVRLTAKDVAFTVNLIKNPEARSPLRINWQDIAVKTIDDFTLQFQLPAVYAAFPHALNFMVLPEHILGQVPAGAMRENTFSRSPVGSGPFSFLFLQGSSSGQPIVHMTTNEKYYGGAPMLNRFEVHAYNTQEAIAKALRSGEVNAATDMLGMSKQVDDANYQITYRPIDSGVYALFNNSSIILKDAKVRQALELATDTQAIRDKLEGPVQPLTLPFINGQLTGPDIPAPIPPDPVKAAALLDQAGWVLDGNVRKKDGQRLALTVTTTKNSQYEIALETLASQWRKLGVIVNANVVDLNDPSINFVQTILQARNYDVLVYELFIGADPDVYAYWHSSQIGATGYNFSNYVNKSSDAALASSRSRLEPDLRNAKYKAFASQWIEDVPAIGLYQPVTSYVSNKHVTAIDPTAVFISAQDRFSNVLYWSVGFESVYKTP